MLRNFLILIFPVFIVSSVGYAGSGGELKNWTEAGAFKINGPVQKSDWQFFWASNDNWRKLLWSHYEKQGKSFDDWAWEWRLAYVQSCESSQAVWCLKILQVSLKSSAILVRSRGVQAWGRRYAGTGSAEAGSVLAGVYAMPENNRNERPLFVKNRILFALLQIGGANNHNLARKLAGTHPGTSQYWARISGTP